MRKVVAAAVLSLAVMAGLTSCSSSGITAEDAYKIGCPAVDSAVGGGSVVGKATVAGLKKLSESGTLDPEPQRWLDATISLLESDDPDKVSSEAKKLIIDGCAENGYPLRNLK
jgi:hypothetical protein